MSFETAQDALNYIRGGNATVTLTSAKTGNHYTFKITKPSVETEAGGKKRDHDADIFFVSGLHGNPDAHDDWHFVGYFFAYGDVLRQSKKAFLARTPITAGFAAFAWALKHLVAGSIPSALTLQHEGSCCRCGRTLTHPESLARGIGPECVKHFV